MISKILIKILVYLAFFRFVHSIYDEKEISDLVRKLINESDYNKDVRPKMLENIPVHVNVSMFVVAIYSISEVNMELVMDFYLRQRWRDSRLSFEPINNITEMSLGGDFFTLVWLPDTFVPNSKSTQTHVSTSPTKGTTLIKLSHTGDILYSTRLTATLNCPMNLAHFPADKQICQIILSSYGYTADDLVYHWHKEGQKDSIILRRHYLPTFQVIGHRSKNFTRTWTTGTYCYLTGEIYIERSLGFYLYQIYLPAFLIVIISFIPFWLGNDDHHARVSLGVTTVLTITTLITSTMETLPKVSYIKAIDIYLFTCFVIVFLSLAEYAFVGYYECRRMRKFSKQIRQNHMTAMNGYLPLKLMMIDHTSKIDQISRIVFPTTFFIFNLVYVFYILVIKHHNEDFD